MPAPSFSKNPLKRPFPDREFGPKTVFGHARTAAFIFAALYFFRPLGLYFGEHHFLISLGYAIVTFVVALVYHFVTEKHLGWSRAGENWTLGKWILDCALVLAFISVANFVYYNALVDWRAFSLVVLGTIALPTIMIGLFPIAFSGMAIQLRAERDNQRTAGQLARITTRITPTPPEIPLVSLSDDFAIEPATILFCESRQNYVRVVYLDQGEVDENIVRATLTGIESALEDTTIVRCHRSYLVNVSHVTTVRGNAQGLRLSLVGLDEEVPVSRAFVADLRARILR